MAGTLFAQTEVTSPLAKTIPYDGNFKSASVNVLYDATGNKYYYSTDLQSTGFYGATLITGTTVVTGNFHAIQVLADCVIDSLVSTKLTGDPNGLSLTAGTTILLNGITRIKLQSGTVWAYKSE